MKHRHILFWCAICLLGIAKARAEPPIYVVDLSSATASERLLAVSLQGLANRDPQSASIYTLSSPEDEGWLFWARRLRPRPIEKATPQQLLDKFRHLVKGQVLCDPGDPYSLNLATSLAGIRDGVLTDSDLGLPTLFDVRGKFKTPLEGYRWAKEEIFPKGSRQGLALLGTSPAFRDYVIKQRLLALALPSLSGREEWGFLAELLSSLPAGGTLFGPAQERTPPAMATWAFRQGHSLVAAEEAANLSFHSQFEPPFPLRQRRQFLELAGRIYVCFLFSGGNDLAYAAGRMNSLWREPERGNLPLAWALPAALSEVAPDMLQAYFAEAYRSGNDSFVVEVNRPSRARAGTFLYLQEACRKTAIGALVVMDEAPEPTLLPALKGLVAQCRPSGIFLPDRKALASRMLDEAVLITKGFSASSPEEILQRLTALPATQAGLIFVWVDSRKISPADIASLVSLLPSYFQVVGAEEFLFLARQVLSGEKEETPSQTKVSLIAPDFARAEEPVAVRATVAGSGHALLLYQQEGGPRFAEPMEKQPDGSYLASLGPLLRGGEWLLQVRLSEGEGRIAWSEVARLRVSEEDTDDDGLNVPEERLFATDAANPDSDGDGLLDGADPHPNTTDSSPALYLGPLLAAEDSPYLVEEHDSFFLAGGRKVGGKGYLIYRLFAEGLPPGAKAWLGLRLRGEAKVAFSAEEKEFGPPLSLQQVGEWQALAIPQELLEKRAFFVRISPSGEPPEEVTLHEVAIFSPLEAPSISPPALLPPYPGPGVPVGVSALLWSPKGIRAAWCAYRVGRGYVSIPMQRIGRGPLWAGELGRFDNSRRLDWWVVAEDGEGQRSASRMTHTWVGTFPGETISLLAGREVNGFWRPTLSAWGPARISDRPGAKDWAQMEVSGGTYEVWALVGGRGRQVALWVDGSFFAGIHPLRPDGWQHLGRIRLSRGVHRVELVCGTGPESAAARHGQLLLTAISSLRPPPQGRLEIANSLALFSPRQGERIGPRTEVSGTAAGNIARVDFYVEGTLLRRFTTPPFSFTWDSGRLSEGRHLLGMVGMGRVGQVLASLEVEVDFAKERPSQ